MIDNQERASAFLENIDTSMYSESELLRQENVVEAILFMMGDSVPVDDIAIALECEHDIALAAAERLVIKYENEYKDRGMKVIRINHKYQMVANNEYFKNLVLIASKPQKPVLTDAVLETLSIIAYKQPITKPEIEDIRGVKSDFAVNRLIEYGLVEEKGRLDAPGRPIILGTTEEFLLRFGLESTEDLPMLPALREAEIRSEVEKELTESFGEPIKLTEEGKLDEGAINTVDIKDVNEDQAKEYDDSFKYEEKKNENIEENDKTSDNKEDASFVEPDVNIGEAEDASPEFSHERHDTQHDEKGDTDDKEPQ